MSVVIPPYNDGWGDQSREHAGDAEFIWGETYGNAARITGEIDTLNVNIIRRAGNSAGQITNTNGNLLIYFQSPVSGRLINIVATLVCTEANFHGSFSDESGVSHATSKQESYLDMWIPGVIDGNSIKEELVNFSTASDGEDSSWYFPIAEPGEERQYRYVPNSTFTAGQLVPLEIAITSRQHGWVNDMQYLAVIRNKWVVRKLDITST